MILLLIKLWLIPAIILYVWLSFIDEGGHIEKTFCFVPIVNVVILMMFIYYIMLDWADAFSKVIGKK